MKSLFTLMILIVASAISAPAASVILAWDPNPEPDLAGYKIYQAQESGAYDSLNPVAVLGTQTTVTFFEGLEHGQTYYWVATAYNTGGMESAFSNEVSVTFSAAPGKPQVLRIIPNN